MEIKCPQCSGGVNVVEGQTFLTCEYCSSAIYIDKSQVVFHYMLEPTLDQVSAEASMKRWMAGSATVKDLDTEAQVVSSEFIYFPIWYFKIKQNGNEVIKVELASPKPIPGIKDIPIPAGDLRFYNDGDAGNSAIQEPHVLYTSAVEWLTSEGVDPSTITQSALVHIPLYIFKYTYKNETFSCVVDGSSSKVMTAEFPTKTEMPYLIVGGGSTILFFIEGMVLSFPAVIGAYLVTALVVIAAAILVAERV
ncbi:MAG: hypothetical protein E4G94_00695 [ANME-2 cluster archaeon]|nr:MAG: hypothetical protein E4G94_00695 [ANME-2 cluster archaeon]